MDLLGPLETLARTPLRKINGPYGLVQVVQPEELLVERVLVSECAQTYLPARACAKVLAAVGIRGQVAFDWQEVRRLADLPQYGILPQCRKLVREVADELKAQDPFDSAG